LQCGFPGQFGINRRCVGGGTAARGRGEPPMRRPSVESPSARAGGNVCGEGRAERSGGHRAGNGGGLMLGKPSGVMCRGIWNQGIRKGITAVPPRRITTGQGVKIVVNRADLTTGAVCACLHVEAGKPRPSSFLYGGDAAPDRRSPRERSRVAGGTAWRGPDVTPPEARLGSTVQGAAQGRLLDVRQPGSNAHLNKIRNVKDHLPRRQPQD